MSSRFYERIIVEINAVQFLFFELFVKINTEKDGECTKLESGETTHFPSESNSTSVLCDHGRELPWKAEALIWCTCYTRILTVREHKIVIKPIFSFLLLIILSGKRGPIFLRFRNNFLFCHYHLFLCMEWAFSGFTTKGCLRLYCCFTLAFYCFTCQDTGEVVVVSPQSGLSSCPFWPGNGKWLSSSPTQRFDIGGWPKYWLHDPRLYSCDNSDVVECLGVQDLGKGPL